MTCTTNAGRLGKSGMVIDSIDQLQDEPTMLTLDLKFKNDKSPCLLCLGAHCDDIEIGCGGTILRYLTMYPDASVFWVVFSGDSVRSEEAKQSAKLFFGPKADDRIVVKQFRDSFFPYVGGEIKDFFKSLQGIYDPDLIFTHYRHDLHQDHRTISELTWNTFRDHFILEYEIPKWDGDLGQPNFFVPLNKDAVEKKLAIILNCYKSQHKREWFSRDTFSALMRLRGIESKSPSRFAEAFYCRKAIV